ncbi:molybdopterin-binding domain of aldehyde dehydrogenase domain-containing protein [Phthorimaea operculella]|nr:molybdopterin-binding domain of aldehyde dehydrogenase domain-containing protein [Phthorimaea operculella]
MTEIAFKINGIECKVDGRYGPDVSLNEYIRNVADLRGTKAMCLEGGCGACVVTVTAAVPPDDEVKTFAVNSCLVSALSCHGWEVTTVEGIGNRTKGYHEIQRRLAQFNGTQCGYCTPGWVSNMYSLHQSKKGKMTSEDIENSFAGNLCRCTGYRPIADAFKTFATDVDETLKNKLVDLEDLDMIKPCWVEVQKKDNMIVVDCGEHKWYKTYKLEHVFDAMKDGDYKLVAGNTGQGVYHLTTDYPKHVIDILDVAELKGHSIDVNLILGAGMPLQEMMELFLKLSNENKEFSYLKKLYDHMDLVAHIPVRNIGTIAGNLCLKNLHKEFPSDLFLLFETVGAMVTIAETLNDKVTVTLDDFLKTNMSGKVLLNILLPPLSEFSHIKTFKIMPRSQNAHAVVNAGFKFDFEHNSNVLKKATIVFGGISPSFIHAGKTETVLKGKDPYSEDTLEMALKSLDEEIVPEEAAPEPSAAYRKMLAIALYYKAILSLSPADKVNPKFRSGGEAIKRTTSKGTQSYETDKTLWPLNQPVPKLEALVQCSGESTFANDYPTQVGELFAAFVTADVNPGSVISGFDAADALILPGVTAFYTAKDIPGKNTFTPSNVDFMTDDEEILADKVVKFNGQPVGIIAADKMTTAIKAARLVKINYTMINKVKPLINIDDVLKSPQKNTRVKMDRTIEPTDHGDDVKQTLEGEFKIPGQYHFTFELQTCVVKPTEDGMEVYSSTQYLDLVNIAIAESLKIPENRINVIVRRVGGGYGSKISRASQIACAAALVSHLQGKVCRFVMPLQDNMKVIGKRLPTNCKYEIGVDDKGVIQYLKNHFYQDVGCSFNESLAAFTAEHFSNGYDSKRWFLEANSVLTDTPSNTWCRAPASTEGVAMIEYMMEKIAYQIKKDPLEVRLANMGEGSPIPEMIDQIKMDCNYDDRKNEIAQFNDNNRWRKRAMKIVPLTYGLFYFGNFNSIISIYHGDGSIMITHGGIEMGQGINTKAAQVCAYKLGVSLDKISVKPSSSFTSPNAVTTGGSIGSECVAFAIIKACDIILERLKPFKEKQPQASWEDIVKEAFKAGIDLQAEFMWSVTTNDIKPYQIYAVCVMEVEVDILTGNHEVRRLDLLEDTGRSLNPEIDVAQIEGALVMGLGYWTSEKLEYDQQTGKLLTDRTWNYKPPGIKDIPADMRIYFRRNAMNPFGVLQSKATGEPALCLATTVIHCLRAAVQAARVEAGYPDEWIDIENPCTIENIFMATGHKIEHFKLN